MIRSTPTQSSWSGSASQDGKVQDNEDMWQKGYEHRAYFFLGIKQQHELEKKMCFSEERLLRETYYYVKQLDECQTRWLRKREFPSGNVTWAMFSSFGGKQEGRLLYLRDREEDEGRICQQLGLASLPGTLPVMGRVNIIRKEATAACGLLCIDLTLAGVILTIKMTAASQFVEFRGAPPLGIPCLSRIRLHFQPESWHHSDYRTSGPVRDDLTDVSEESESEEEETDAPATKSAASPPYTIAPAKDPAADKRFMRWIARENQ